MTTIGALIWSVFARGTRNIPVWDLREEKAGTSCEGIVFALPDATTRDDLIPLWEREMWTETYHPEWVMDKGVWVSTRADLRRHRCRQYAGDLPVVKAAYIASIRKYGTCYDYRADGPSAIWACMT